MWPIIISAGLLAEVAANPITPDAAGVKVAQALDTAVKVHWSHVGSSRGEAQKLKCVVARDLDNAHASVLPPTRQNIWDDMLSDGT